MRFATGRPGPTGTEGRDEVTAVGGAPYPGPRPCARPVRRGTGVVAIAVADGPPDRAAARSSGTAAARRPGVGMARLGPPTVEVEARSDGAQSGWSERIRNR